MGVAVFLLGASGFVWVCGDEEQEAFCEGPQLQAWLLGRAEEDPMPDPETFWEDLPAVRRTPKGALKALFQASEGRQDYYRVDGTEDCAWTWNGSVVREVADGYYIEKRAGGGWGVLDGRRFEELIADGYLATKEEYEAARRDASGPR
jgi:hypothetical protein